MTPENKRDRAKRLREIAATKHRQLADEILDLARRLESDADLQEREAGDRAKRV